MKVQPYSCFFAIFLSNCQNFSFVLRLDTRRPGRLLNALCTFNLRPVSTGITSGVFLNLRNFRRPIFEIWPLQDEQKPLCFPLFSSLCYTFIYFCVVYIFYISVSLLPLRDRDSKAKRRYSSINYIYKYYLMTSFCQTPASVSTRILCILSCMLESVSIKFLDVFSFIFHILKVYLKETLMFFLRDVSFLHGLF